MLIILFERELLRIWTMIRSFAQLDSVVVPMLELPVMRQECHYYGIPRR